MKNIHLLATENYKQDYTTMRGEAVEVIRLGQLILNKKTGELSVNKNPQWAASCDTDILVPHHIYITSDDELKDVDWCILLENHYLNGGIGKYNSKKAIGYGLHNTTFFQKIILTTDQDLIKDGVQAINDEFLEWFMKNPSCEFVDVKLNSFGECHGNDCSCFDDGDQKVCIFYYPDYKTIIQQEEPKQETLEEAAEHFIQGFGEYNTPKQSFIAGAKWQAERMYSDEEVLKILQTFCDDYDNVDKLSIWFKQFKKK